MASQDLIFPLLPRNTTVAVNSDLDRVTELQKKQRIKSIAGDDAGDETQQARVEERQKRRQEERRKKEQSEAEGKPEQQLLKEADEKSAERVIDPDNSKGQNLDTFA